MVRTWGDFSTVEWTVVADISRTCRRGRGERVKVSERARRSVAGVEVEEEK